MQEGTRTRNASPELVRLVLAEAGGEVHGHAVLLARSEKGAVLRGQSAAAMRLRVGGELERRSFPPHDAQRVDGAPAPCSFCVDVHMRVAAT